MSISVTAALETGLVATASADYIPAMRHWWVSRVLVRAPADRGKGHGSAVLAKLLEEIAKAPVKVVHVIPGGYSDDTERQRAFYERAGFKAWDEEETIMVWTGG
jgi:L-amino acid N-acyltransferase YncA